MARVWNARLGFGARAYARRACAAFRAVGHAAAHAAAHATLRSERARARAPALAPPPPPPPPIRARAPQGGDHSIGFPTVRGIASVTSKKIGIIHIDRHADIQEKDMDERMHTTPYFHATNLPNVRPENLVQIGIGGWQVPRVAVSEMVKRKTNIFTMQDLEELGIDKVAEMALEQAWCGTDAVYLSYDIDSIEAAFVPGTGWPEPGGLLPREALKLVGLVAKEGLCGMEIVEVSPPYDVSDITSLMALRLMVDTMGALVAHGKMGAHKRIIDKPFVPF